MEKEVEDLFYSLKISSPEYYKKSDSDYNVYIKQRQEYRNLNYRMNKGYNAKTLHPLPKDK